MDIPTESATEDTDSLRVLEAPEDEIGLLLALGLGRGEREDGRDEDRGDRHPDEERHERVALSSPTALRSPTHDHHVLYGVPSIAVMSEPDLTSMIPGGSSEAASAESGSS